MDNERGFALGQLDRVQAMFPRVEGKASFLFALDVAMLAVVAVNLKLTASMGWEGGIALATIVILEDKKLEDSKNMIVTNNAKNKAQLIKQEDEILDSLAKNQDTLLSEDTIIERLAGSKKKSNEIKQDVMESIKNEAECDKQRERYRVLAFHSSILFFCIINLSNIDPMYQYSLQWFITLFKASVKNTESTNTKGNENEAAFQARIDALTSNFTEALYKNVCRSLFGKDKLLFSFLMVTRVLEGEEIFKDL